MHAGPHYYVISLSKRSNALFEAFRDTLIDIRNGGFPIEPPTPIRDSVETDDKDERLRETLRLVDEYFGRYYEEEPLKLVVVGESEMRAAFLSVTSYQDVIVGHVEGDYSETSLRDLGKIVWPIVVEAMSGLQNRAKHDLDDAESKRQIAFGIDSVSRRASASVGTTLLVEEDYHLRGSINEGDPSLTVSQDVDVRAVVDDVVDAVIEKVLSAGGNVILVPSGSLKKLKRIVLLFAEEDACAYS
jgi:hypothetical protein